MQQDKKVSAGTIYCVVPERIGFVRVVALEKDQARAWFETIGMRETRRTKVSFATSRSR